MTGKERKNTEHIDGEKSSSDGTEKVSTAAYKQSQTGRKGRRMKTRGQTFEAIKREKSIEN